MNKAALKLIGQTTRGWAIRAQQEHVSVEQKLDLILFHISELAKALYTDGTQESVEEWYDFGEKND